MAKTSEREKVIAEIDTLIAQQRTEIARIETIIGNFEATKIHLSANGSANGAAPKVRKARKPRKPRGLPATEAPADLPGF